MVTKSPVRNTAEAVLASLSPDTLAELADLIIAKLAAEKRHVLLPKQDVVGSNPITRSNKSSILLNSSRLISFANLLNSAHCCPLS